MSLDIAILGADGCPKKQVSIGVDEHYRLTQIIGGMPDSLLARMNDFYADAEFENSDLDGLAVEVQSLLVRCKDDEGLIPFLKGLSELIVEAKKEQKPLLAIAD
jgi:hypothetical protein